MAKLKGILLTEGMHGMISQVEGLAKALEIDFTHHKVETNFFWKLIPPNLSPVSQSVFKKITDFYHANQNETKTEVVAGDFVTNIDKKSTPSKTIDLPDQLKDEIHASLLEDLEQWSSTKLLPTYVYGIRIYQNGAILSSHKDRRETHIIGTIINIDQDLINEWPLEIEDHDGEVHKIYLEPGEVIFYESATLIHGRPDPLEGKFFSNVFCHYMPKIS